MTYILDITPRASSKRASFIKTACGGKGIESMTIQLHAVGNHLSKPFSVLIQTHTFIMTHDPPQPQSQPILPSIPQPRRRIRRPDRTDRPHKQTNRNSIHPLRLMLVPLGQFRTLARLQDTEYNHTDKSPHELWEGGEEVQDAEVDAGQFAGGRGGGGCGWRGG